MDFQMDPQSEMANSYRVEVSGWDASENFFVEKTTLHWSGDESKEVSLRSPVREGCVVFVRLLQQLAHTDTIPIAYHVAKLIERDTRGCTTVRLAQLYPREPAKQTAETSKDSAIRLA